MAELSLLQARRIKGRLCVEAAAHFAKLAPRLATHPARFNHAIDMVHHQGDYSFVARPIATTLCDSSSTRSSSACWDARASRRPQVARCKRGSAGAARNREQGELEP